jgi:Cof subfamily protein (haloacid dehalogenase superfamily)
MEKIRLLALDVDGTLLSDEKLLSPENREAIQAAFRRGVHVAIASGRMTPRIEPIEDLLGLDCHILAYNGAKVVGQRAEGRPTIVHTPVEASVAEELIHYSRDHGLLLNLYLDDRLHAERGPTRDALRELYATRTGAEYALVDDLRSFIGCRPTKMILLAEESERDRLHDEFRARLAGRAFVTKSEPEYMEVMSCGIDKGAALLFLARHLGLGAESVMAMGDATNDTEMLAAAGLGVAMANAPAGVKAAARSVTSRSNNDSGVAEAVSRWILEA